MDKSVFKKIKLFLFDQDGTLYLGNRLYPFTIEMLETCPPAEPFMEEEIYDISDIEDEPFTVDVDRGIYFVYGRAMDRLINSVNFENEESLNFFHRSLRKLGVIDALRERGAKEGDSVVFGGLLGEAPIMSVNKHSPSVFINRGGRVPAPIHSLKN